MFLESIPCLHFKSTFIPMQHAELLAHQEMGAYRGFLQQALVDPVGALTLLERAGIFTGAASNSDTDEQKSNLLMTTVRPAHHQAWGPGSSARDSQVFGH